MNEIAVRLHDVCSLSLAAKFPLSVAESSFCLSFGQCEDTE